MGQVQYCSALGLFCIVNWRIVASRLSKLIAIIYAMEIRVPAQVDDCAASTAGEH